MRPKRARGFVCVRTSNATHQVSLHVRGIAKLLFIAQTSANAIVLSKLPRGSSSFLDELSLERPAGYYLGLSRTSFAKTVHLPVSSHADVCGNGNVDALKHARPRIKVGGSENRGVRRPSAGRIPVYGYGLRPASC
jgi:hypothetical protein